MCEAILKSIEEEVSGETINIAGGKPVTINELAKKVMDITGKNLELKYLPMRKGDIRKSYADVEKAMKILGFKAMTSLEKGLYKTIRTI